MKDKILSIIAFVTVFFPMTVFLVWEPADPNATSIVIGYCIFIVLSFCYTWFLFVKKQLKNTYTKISLGLNSFYLLLILVSVVLPRLR